MNRVGLGLAVGAGYLLGRTKKLKMAVAVGGLVAGKKMNLSPRMVADLVQQQLRNNPQFKEIGDQLRQDLRGVGKAASGAMVERQLDAFADRLHGRTAQVRDQLSGVVPGGPEGDAEDAEDEEPEAEAEDSGSEDDEESEPAKAAKKAPAKKAPGKTARKAPAKKAPAKKTAGKKTAAKKTTAGNRGGSSRNRLPKGGGEG
ncbi:DNA primase [Streptomyces coeruleorubidus]|uniref:DNA primase n=1 Tax=Streptomyces coeruleorubidus TaxID=116188 RepID=UPI0033BC88E1